jgi:MinD-like ATPase involved in chromosome partitioning or flagellar assembly
MIEVVVIDVSASVRLELHDEISQSLSSKEMPPYLPPQVSVVPLSIQELQFRDKPKLAFLGNSFSHGDLHEIRPIRRLLPETLLILNCKTLPNDPHFLDEVFSLGVDDVIIGGITVSNLMPKLIRVSRDTKSQASGKILLIDGAKGGVGTTAVAGAIVDGLSLTGKKSAIIDLDIDSRDLSRFLRARPLYNDSLEEILKGDLNVSPESVSRCFLPIADNGNFTVMTPALPCGEHADARHPLAQRFFSVLKSAHALFDYLVIDAGSARGTFLECLYKISDKIILVTNNDPATLFATVEKLNLSVKTNGSTTNVVTVINAPSTSGLPLSLISNQLANLIGVTSLQDEILTLPKCEKAARWPASGQTMLGLGNKRFRRKYKELLLKLSDELPYFLNQPNTLQESLLAPYLTSLGNTLRKGSITVSRKLIPKSVLSIKLLAPPSTQDEKLSDKSEALLLIDKPQFNEDLSNNE